MARILETLRATRAWFRDGSISLASKLLVLFAVVYVVSPVDLIPDVPLIGWLDDVGVLAFVAHHIMRSFQRQARKPATVVVEARRERGAR